MIEGVCVVLRGCLAASGDTPFSSNYLALDYEKERNNYLPLKI